MTYIDPHSDTVTEPTTEMREVMCSEAVSDDVYEDDPIVNRSWQQRCWVRKRLYSSLRAPRVAKPEVCR